MTNHLNGGHFQYLQKRGVSFGGTKVCRTSYYAATGLLDKSSPAVLAVLHSIQIEFGREVLTHGYAKLAAIGRVLTSEVAKYDTTTTTLFLYVLQALLFKLRYGMFKPVDVTRDSLYSCLLYTSPSPRDGLLSRMPSSA